MMFISRRGAVTGTAALAVAAIAAPRPAEAFLPFLLFRLLGATRAGAAGLGGRASLAGRTAARPLRTERVRDGYGNERNVQTALDAGRWVRAANNLGKLSYDDPEEYRSDVARHPEAFGAVPAEITIDNSRSSRPLHLPQTDIQLRLDDGRVWDSYSLSPATIRPGDIGTYELAMTGVPVGWGFRGVYNGPTGPIWSDHVGPAAYFGQMERQPEYHYRTPHCETIATHTYHEHIPGGFRTVTRTTRRCYE